MDLLKLVHFTILSVVENEHDFQIKVETNSPPSSCPHCGCVANLYKHSNKEQLCMDLPIHGKRGNITKLKDYESLSNFSKSVGAYGQQYLCCSGTIRSFRRSNETK
ncbi:transposase family protein [Paenibacillus apiarius]|uniref:transposase family protein n=1 Tax=Paenibacillus apiarius TaxID=46240 RepID=UPI003B3B1695